MEKERKPHILVRLARGIYRGFNVTRRLAMNAVFFAFVVGFFVLVFSGPRVPRSTVLVLEPKGAIVEQLSGRAPDLGLEDLLESVPTETLLRDLLDAIKAAKDDKRVKAILLDLEHMGGASLPKLEELRAALLDFKKSGKKVIAAAEDYGQSAYHMASSADEIFLAPRGLVRLEGFSIYRTYYRDAIDRLGVDWHIFRVGEYKSYVEPYMRDGMSEEARENDADWLGDLWRAYLEQVASARRLKPEALQALAETFPERLREAGGDPAEVARKAGLIDRIGSREEVRKRLVELAGVDESGHTYPQIGLSDYLAAAGGDRTGSFGTGDAVAVVIAKGDMLDGTQPPGRIGGDSTAELIRKARLDEKVKAVVLRVDSGGGSVHAAEVIGRELALVRQAKKPLVVSFGGVAASGGYWIAATADEIWASPSTITGSIGIFAMFPTFDRPLAKYLGIRVDGFGTAPLAGAFRPDKPLAPQLADVLQQLIDRGYEDFLERVGKGRRMSREDVDRLARGRVWSGEDAKKVGLVDQLGSLRDAVASAAKSAKLAEGYRVMLVEKERTLKERLLTSIFESRLTRMTSWRDLFDRVGTTAEEPGSRRPSPVETAWRTLRSEVSAYARFNDPNGLYAHCLCTFE